MVCFVIDLERSMDFTCRAPRGDRPRHQAQAVPLPHLRPLAGGGRGTPAPPPGAWAPAEVRSIQGLATKLRRDYKNTYDDLAALEAWGLVAVRREGKNQRPVSHVTSLRVSWEK